MRALAGGLDQLAHALWSQAGCNGLTGGPVKRLRGRFKVRLVGVDRVLRGDMVRGGGRWRLSDGHGSNDRMIVATIDVEASRIRMLGHVALPFLASRSAR